MSKINSQSMGRLSAVYSGEPEKPPLNQQQGLFQQVIFR